MPRRVKTTDGPAWHDALMSAHGPDGEGFDEMIRAVTRELGRFIERSMESVDLDELAGMVGVDPAAASSWAHSAGSWLSAQAENLGEELALRIDPKPRAGFPSDPMSGVAPHPLDLPTDEQGRALAALDSGRWTVEPGTETLTAKGEGPAPRGALGIVRELRVRDWITREGELTMAGRHALGRWLRAASTR